ncbi:unnamed protein product, partial [Cyprideis torosa]
ASGLGPSAGLYGAIFLGFFAAIFGGTATQISGPTAPITAISTILIAGILQANDGDISRSMPIILAVFIMAGVIQVVIGGMGLGQYIKYIPYPNSGVIGAIRSLPRALEDINYTEFVLALLTIIIIFGFKKITTTIPSTLVALTLVSGAAMVIGLEYRPIQEIPSGFPIFRTDIFSEFQLGSLSPHVFTAITLAFLGAIDSLLTSVVADNMTKTSHKPNRELIGQGIGNTIGALFGGLPGAGATIRTVVNINAGGVTKLSGMIAGLFLLVILLVMGPLASKIPAAVLAGILITVGIGVMDYKGLRAIPSMPYAEVVVMI